MSKSKYYTPELQEFHAGFEYEVLNNGAWEKQVLNEDMIVSPPGSDEDTDQPFTFKSEINRFRVKHLDTQDVLELGFTENVFKGYSDELFGFPIEFSRWKDVPRGVVSEPVLSLQYGSHMNGDRGVSEEHLIFRQFKFGEMLIAFKYYGDRSFNFGTVFKGKIKNKSELKRLLKQLEVI